MQETWFDPIYGKIRWRRKWQPTLVFLPGNSHRKRRLVATVHGVAKELDTMTKQHHAKSTLMYSGITRPLALPALSECPCLSLLLLMLFSFQILFFPVQTLYFALKFLLVHGLGASGLTSAHPLCDYSRSPCTRFLATLWVSWLPAHFMFISCGPISDQYPPSQYFVRLLVPWTSMLALFILPRVHCSLFPLEGRLEEKEGNETWDQLASL